MSTAVKDPLQACFDEKQEDLVKKSRNFVYWLAKLLEVPVKNVDTEVQAESIMQPILRVTGDKQLQAAAMGKNLAILQEMIKLELGKPEGKETPFYLDMVKPILQDESAAASLNAEQILLAISSQGPEVQAKFFLYLEYFSGGWQLD